ncbi:CUB and sushi domain-containing protein 3-like [Mytilus trossulus]|uniref:CUB and sushi domain-containing protein 3-like n=1 Tax=Mytilus trossulus TaxID=6551 RepID=UPI003006B119
MKKSKAMLFSAACSDGSTIDEDGKTCIKCPADEYWVNQTACESCPNNGTTEGKTGVTGVEFCKAVIECQDLEEVDFATITEQTGIQENDTTTYKCNTGYELISGDLIRECIRDTWNGSSPVCVIVSCPCLADVKFSSITTQTGGNYQDTITYACNPGYELTSGSLTRQCLVDKTWNGSAPICEIVSCPSLADVNFSIAAQTGSNYKDTITYACIAGYELTSGSLTRQCMDDKTWNGSVPVCGIVGCSLLTDVKFSNITTQTGGNYQDTITYACITGYELTSGSLTRQCMANGTWFGSAPVCDIISCPNLAGVRFSVAIQTGTNYQDTITYACITGYELTSGSLTRQCMDDKTWNGSAPICERVICPRLVDVEFSNAIQTGSNYQDTITYDCITGYELTSGSLTRQCMDDKTWNGSAPICEIVSCPSLANVNFSIAAQTGSNLQDTITYACITGYELTSGSLTRQCLDDKTWNGSVPICEIVTCPGLADVKFANITNETGSNYQDTITYACITGYKLTSGSLTRQCMDDKTWNGSPPVCEIVTCPVLADMIFAITTNETGTNYQDTITYACNPGYELTSGSLTRQCMDDKTWNGSAPICGKHFSKVSIL